MPRNRHPQTDRLFKHFSRRELIKQLELRELIKQDEALVLGA
jgi:hypothetical protein